MTIEFIRPYNIGWLESKLDNRFVDILWKYIDKSKKENNVVEENIPPNLSLSDENNYFFNNVIVELISEYSRVFENLGNNSGVTHTHNYCLRSMWANFQKQHDFNPLHSHDSIYSFVVFMKIPTEWEEQHSLKHSMAEEVGNHTRCSDFQFVYTDILGRNLTYTYLMDKHREGTMLLFPSKLNHTVYPFFNSDEYRITISGNISLNTSFTIS